MATSCKRVEVGFEDPFPPHKWCVPLTEDVFGMFMAKGSLMAHKVFGEGSLFSPLLFKKFFDPSDAFPLWEFESGLVLSDPQNPERTTVDWFQTDTYYTLKAELPRLEKNYVEPQINVENNGKVVEISGRWKQHQGDSSWRSKKWWEHGFVRRLEIPENADWKKTEAQVSNDVHLEIRIPYKNRLLDHNIPRGNDEDD